MEIYFCDACGKRVSEGDIEQGRAIQSDDGNVHCGECRSTRPEAKAARASGPRRRRSGAGSRSGTLRKGSRQPDSASRIRAHGASREKAGGRGGALAIVLIASIVGGLGVTWLATRGGRQQASSRERKRPPIHIPVQKRPKPKEKPRPYEPPRPAGPPRPAAGPPVQAAANGKASDDDLGPAAFAKGALDAAGRFARANPNDLRGQIDRYQRITRNYANTDAARKAAEIVADLKLRVPDVVPGPAPVTGDTIELFNGRDLSGWSCRAGTWSVSGGLMRTFPQTNITLGRDDLGDGELSLEVRSQGIEQELSKTFQVYFRRFTRKTHRTVMYAHSNGVVWVAHDRTPDGSDKQIARDRNTRLLDGNWHKVSFKTRGTRVQVVVDGRRLFDVPDAITGAPGGLALRTSFRQGHIDLRGIRFTPAVKKVSPSAFVGTTKVICDFENDRQMRLFERTKPGFVELSEQHVTRGTRSLKMTIRPGGKRILIAAAWTGFPKDLSGYTHLAMDIFVESTAAKLRAGFELQDKLARGDFPKRGRRHFNLQPGSNTMRIGLEDFKSHDRTRTIDMARIVRLMILFDAGTNGTFYLDHLRLEKPSSALFEADFEGPGRYQLEFGSIVAGAPLGSAGSVAKGEVDAGGKNPGVQMVTRGRDALFAYDPKAVISFDVRIRNTDEFKVMLWARRGPNRETRLGNYYRFYKAFPAGAWKTVRLSMAELKAPANKAELSPLRKGDTFDNIVVSVDEADQLIAIDNVRVEISE